MTRPRPGTAQAVEAARAPAAAVESADDTLDLLVHRMYWLVDREPPLAAPEPAPLPAGREGVARVARVVDRLLAARAAEADLHREDLVKAMITVDIDPVPHATIAQARRLARHRDQLLASGAYTLRALRELRGDNRESTTRTWLARQRSSGNLFTVARDGGTLLPAFELDRSGAPRPGLRPVLTALAGAGMGGWELWTWFVSGSPWLGGAAPADLLDERTARVAEAAERFSSNAVPA